MNESEQAQAIEQRIAGIKKAYHEVLRIASTVNRAEITQEQRAIGELMDFVDSQAQKIESQAMHIEKLAGLNHVAEVQIERQTQKIADLVAHLKLAIALHKDAVEQIAEQSKTIEINAAYAIELQGKIAEQAKRIAELETFSAEELIAKEFWLRGYREAHTENSLKQPELFSDGFDGDWYDQYGGEFTEGGNFKGKYEELP